MNFIVTFSAVLLTVASAFTFGIASGYLAICGILRLMDRRDSEGPATVKLRVQIAASGD